MQNCLRRIGLKKKRNGDLFVWENEPEMTEPSYRTLAEAKITAEITALKSNFPQPVEYRFADDIRGEIRRELNVVPKISLDFDKDLKSVKSNRKSSNSK